MEMQTLISCPLIFAGSTIMLMSLVRSKAIMRVVPFVPEEHRARVRTHLILHRVLMSSFLLGYLVVLVAFIYSMSLLSEVMVAAILFFGAIFVFIGIAIQARLVAEVEQTLRGIVRICAKCKKILTDSDSPDDPAAWDVIEGYIEDRVSVQFSHGYCPECKQDELNKIRNGKRQSGEPAQRTGLRSLPEGETQSP